MELMSKDFENEEMMDSKFTCDGQDISPHLKWGDAPSGTKSFALCCEDPDAPSGNWIHWMIVNIPAKTTEIPQNGPVPGKEIENDFGKTSYGGPCPPSGTHRYIFTVYALDTKKVSKVDKIDFKPKIKKHTLDSAELIGLYKKQ